MLVIDLDKEIIGGVAKASDIKRKGLIKASVEAEIW